MPGQPKKLAANMTRLECDAYCLAADIWITMPRKYEKAPPPHAEHDAVWQGWRRCSHFALQLHNEVFQQANRMRQKASLEPISDSFDEPPDDGTPNGKTEPPPAG